MSQPMHNADTTQRCDVSRRCRQPALFNVDGGSWRSTVCEKHAGVLLLRRLSGSTSEPLRVTLRTATSSEAQS